MWCSFFVIKNFVKNLHPLFNDILAGMLIYLYFTWIVTTTLTKIYTGDGDGNGYEDSNDLLKSKLRINITLTLTRSYTLF